MTLMRRMLSALAKPRFNWIQVIVVAGVFGAALATHLKFARQSDLDAAAFQSPLPDVRIAEEKQIPDSTAYRRQYDFSVDWFTRNIPVWERALCEFKGKPGVHYLEIGAYEGRSAVWMLENILTESSAKLTVIDVFDGPYRKKYFDNIERTSAAKKVTTIADFSQLSLRGLPLASFDIIYIDGSHTNEDVLEDAVVSWRLLKVGGIMIFDDYRWGCFVRGSSAKPIYFPKTAIDAFTECFGDYLEVIHNSNQVVLRKK